MCMSLGIQTYYFDAVQNSDNKPWAYICSKGFFAGLIFGGANFRRVLLLEGILRFKMRWTGQLK